MYPSPWEHKKRYFPLRQYGSKSLPPPQHDFVQRLTIIAERLQNRATMNDFERLTVQIVQRFDNSFNGNRSSSERS